MSDLRAILVSDVLARRGPYWEKHGEHRITADDLRAIASRVTCGSPSCVMPDCDIGRRVIEWLNEQERLATAATENVAAHDESYAEDHRIRRERKP